LWAGNLSDSTAIALGDEILALNGVRMNRWLERTERHVSAETPYMAHSLMEYDFPIYLWLELGAAETFDIETRSADGRRHRLQLPARSQPPALNLEQPLREAKMLDAHVALPCGPARSYNAEATTCRRAVGQHRFSRLHRQGIRGLHARQRDRLIIDLRGQSRRRTTYSAT
jgi:hypothetical protein